MAALTLALRSGPTPDENEPWVLPEQLSYARANESVDLLSVCKVASHILYLLSGKRYGVRTETIRPAYTNSCLSLTDYISLSERVGFPISSFGGQPESVVRLKGPVQEIQSVIVDGVELDPEEYVVFDSRYLVRVNGEHWPLNQRIQTASTQSGTFSITYQWGQPVPEGGKLAAHVFATELAKYVNKDGSALPDRTVSITRQGVSQTVLDPSDFVKEQRVGLYLVDTWIGSVNPSGLRRRPTITNPDDVINRRQT